MDRESRSELRSFKDESQAKLNLTLFESDDDYSQSADLDQSDLDEDECSDVESSGEDFFEDFVPKKFAPVQFNPNSDRPLTEEEKQEELRKKEEADFNALMTESLNQSLRDMKAGRVKKNKRTSSMESSAHNSSQ